MPFPGRRATPEWRQYYDSLSARPDAAGIARRSFVQGMLAAGALGASGLQWLGTAPTAAALGPDENILVVVLFGGGNDGFSMVVPADDGRYVDARGPLAIAPQDAIPLESGLYWNPNLPGIASRYNAGNVAVVQGIGDPADDHSHFSSMARWMRGNADSGGALGVSGWLGRWLDGAGANEFGGMAVGDSGVPLHMRGLSSKVTSLSSEGNLYGADVEPYEVPAIEAMIEMADNNSGGIWPNAIARTMADAIGNAAQVSPIYGATLPERFIQRDLALAAEAINLDIGARVLTVSFGSFDTHENHVARQQDLMLAFDEAVTEFFSRLNPAFADRVTLMTFSEFGRSWTANASAGIDHGTGSNALVIGNAVQGGLYGEQPDFTNRDSNDDVESTVDFRSYYGTILDDWLDGDSQQIIGGNFENLGIFTTGPGDTHMRGDVNCDDELNVTDALMIAQYSVGNRTDSGTCPLTDPATQIHAASGDINEDGFINVADALLVAQCAVGNDNGYCPPA